MHVTPSTTPSLQHVFSQSQSTHFTPLYAVCTHINPPLLLLSSSSLLWMMAATLSLSLSDFKLYFDSRKLPNQGLPICTCFPVTPRLMGQIKV